MIRALALDYGNVVSESQDTGCYARMAALSGLSEAYFREAFWRYRPAYDRGDLSGVEMYQAVLREAFGGGESPDSAETGTRRELAEALLAEDLASWRRVSRPVTEWARSLQGQGYSLAILSNMPHDFLERYGDSIQLFREADVAVFSCQVSQIKPERAIYETLIRRLGMDPSEIVFFDDMEANVAGAREAGINAFLWTGLDRAREDWASVTDPSPFSSRPMSEGPR